MDFDKCFQILNSRRNQSTNSSENNILNERNDFELLRSENISTIELLSQILRAQENRITTYRFFEDTFHLMLKDGGLTNYPELCTQMTSEFSYISNSIINMKNELSNRKENDIVVVLNRLQAYEKQKLLYIAAKHLDLLNTYLSLVDCKIEKPSENDSIYLSKKIRETEENISETCQELVGFKCELIDANVDNV